MKREPAECFEPGFNGSWNDALNPFFNNGADNQPDSKKLADLLRQGRPLPPGFEMLLAELLDPHAPGRLAAEWQLRPVYTGRKTREMKKRFEEDLTYWAMCVEERAEVAVKTAASEAVISERKAWSIWKSIKDQISTVKRLNMKTSRRTDWVDEKGIQQVETARFHSFKPRIIGKRFRDDVVGGLSRFRR